MPAGSTERTPAGAGRDREPPTGDRDQRTGGCEREPQIRRLDAVGEPRVGTDEEDVVRVVVPARRVEEGIAEERSAERREHGLGVDKGDRETRGRRPETSARVREDEVEEERKRKAGGNHGEAADDRLAALPTDPEGREPDEAGEYCEVADSRCSADERGQEASGDEGKRRADGQSGEESRPPRIRRELTGTTGDDEGADGVHDRDRAGREPGDRREVDRAMLHGRIVAALTTCEKIRAGRKAHGPDSVDCRDALEIARL
jgi:hypothetical protein